MEPDSFGGDPGAVTTMANSARIFDKVDERLSQIAMHHPRIGRLMAHYPITSRGALALVAGCLLLLLVPPLVRVLLKFTRRTAENFRGDKVVVGCGLSILVWSECEFGLLRWLYPDARGAYSVWMAVLLGFGALGLLDDLFGSPEHRGLGAHFRALFAERRVTTGLIKAAGGCAVALWCAHRIYGCWGLQTVAAAAVIALCANAINLLDLRPGRALAAFLSASFALCILARRSGASGLIPLALMSVPALVIYPADADGKTMLGDFSGSNLLGAALGLAIVTRGGTATAAALAALIALHILAERKSLTEIIAGNPVLRGLDRLTGVR